MAKAVNIDRSHRLDGIGEYYFSRRLREIADIEAATGRQIVKLAMGSPDLPPHQSVIDRLAKEALRPDVHKYMSYKGEPILRKAFADWYKNGTAWSSTTTPKCCPSSVRRRVSCTSA